MSPRRGRRISIGAQIFFSSLLAVFAIATPFSLYEMYRDTKSIRLAIDERLKTAAYGLREILPNDYFDKLLKGEVEKSEYDALRSRLNDYRKKVGVQYLYAVGKFPDGKIRYLLDTSSPEPFRAYDNPTPMVLRALSSREVTIDQELDFNIDKKIRTALVPCLSSGGNFFVSGADIELKYVREEIFHLVSNFFFLLLLGLFFTGIIAFFLSRKISAPIRRLSKFALKLAENNFAKDLKPDEPIGAKTLEVATLDRNIALMRRSLSEYIENLKIAVGAKERAESELKIAGEIQKSFLPKESIETENFSIFGDMKSSREAGGDLFSYEVSENSGNLAFVIGDVSGKGMPAALFMARAITLAKISGENFDDVSEIARAMNEQLCKNNETCTFVTLFFGIFNPETKILKFVNCGHNPPYLKRDGKVFSIKVKPNTALGAIENANFQEEQILLNPGDEILLYTDGVCEATAPDGTFFGDERTREIFSSMPPSATPREVCAKIMSEVLKFGSEQADDTTVLCLKISK